MPTSPEAPVTKRRFWIVAIVFLAITLTSFAVLQIMKQREDLAIEATSAAANDSGNEFLVDGQPVRVRVDGLLKKFETDGALGLTLRLDPFATGDTGGLANETHGRLLPTLRISGCDVEPPQAYGVRTDQPIAAFTWHWSVVCPNAGRHDLSVLIAFDLDDRADSGTSDPIAYRESTTISSYDPFFQRFTTAVAFLSAVVALLSSGLGLYEQVKPKSRQSSAARADARDRSSEF